MLQLQLHMYIVAATLPRYWREKLMMFNENDGDQKALLLYFFFPPLTLFSVADTRTFAGIIL
jgi:hypothetical protein